MTCGRDARVCLGWIVGRSGRKSFGRTGEGGVALSAKGPIIRPSATFSPRGEGPTSLRSIGMPSTLLGGGERLGEVVDQVLWVFEADGEANQLLADA